MTIRLLDRAIELAEAGKITHLEMPGTAGLLAMSPDELRAARDVMAEVTEMLTRLGQRFGVDADEFNIAADAANIIRAWHCVEVPLGDDSEPRDCDQLRDTIEAQLRTAA